MQLEVGFYNPDLGVDINAGEPGMRCSGLLSEVDGDCD